MRACGAEPVLYSAYAQSPGQSFRIKEAGRLTLIGTVIGLAGAIGAGMSMRKLLFGVQSWDPSILGSVAAVIVVCALLASYIPARRATKVDPMIALRAE